MACSPSSPTTLLEGLAMMMYCVLLHGDILDSSYSGEVMKSSVVCKSATYLVCGSVLMLESILHCNRKQSVETAARLP